MNSRAGGGFRWFFEIQILGNSFLWSNLPAWYEVEKRFRAQLKKLGEFQHPEALPIGASMVKSQLLLAEKSSELLRLTSFAGNLSVQPLWVLIFNHSCYQHELSTSFLKITTPTSFIFVCFRTSKLQRLPPSQVAEGASMKAIGAKKTSDWPQFPGKSFRNFRWPTFLVQSCKTFELTPGAKRFHIKVLETGRT